MPKIDAKYVGALRTESVHQPSGAQIITDAPTDNHGKGEAFSPTDLLCASLGSCMATIMAIHAEKQGLALPAFSYHIQKFMQISPRRVSKARIQFTFEPGDLSNEAKESLIAAARACPVALSLHPDLVQEVEFTFLGS